MEKMILLGTHGRFGEELIKSAELILGEMKDVRSFSLLPGMALEDYIPSVAETLGKLPNGAGGLVDVVATGKKLPMLMEVYMNKDQLSNQELADHAVSTLKESGKNATRILGETP